MPKETSRQTVLLNEFIDLCWKAKKDFRRQNDNFKIWEEARKLGVADGLDEKAIGALFLGLEACKAWMTDKSRKKINAEMTKGRETTRRRKTQAYYAGLFETARDMAHFTSSDGVNGLITHMLMGFSLYHDKKPNYLIFAPLLDALALILLEGTVHEGVAAETIKDNIRQRFIRFSKLKDTERNLRLKIADMQFREVFAVFVKRKRVRTLEDRRLKP